MVGEFRCAFVESFAELHHVYAKRTKCLSDSWGRRCFTCKHTKSDDTFDNEGHGVRVLGEGDRCSKEHDELEYFDRKRLCVILTYLSVRTNCDILNGYESDGLDVAISR